MNGAIPRDANRIPIGDYAISKKVMNFAGGTTNDPGDYDGTGNPATLFTVTGVISAKLLAICTVNLAGASATLSVGTALTAAGLIAQTTATDIDANEIWHDATPDASVEAASVLTEKIIKSNIIQTAGTANITSGQIEYYLLWKPLSANADVVAA